MTKYFIIIFFSIFLILVGFNFTFNTNKTLNKIIELGKIDKQSDYYKLITSNTNYKSTKFGGIAVIVFASILLCMCIYSIIKYKN
jgi:hypothetical protein